MSYKLLAELNGHAGEALEANLRAKEFALQAAIKRRNELIAPAAAATGFLKSRVQVFEKIARQQELAKLDADIPALITQIKKAGGDDVEADGTVRKGPKRNWVQYDYTLEMQNMTRVKYDGALKYAKDNSVVDTTGFPMNALGNAGVAMYAMSNKGNLHVAQQVDGKRHHSSLFAGGNLASAGEIKVERGRVSWISNNSGHYLPNWKHFLQILHAIGKLGVPLTFRVQHVWDSAHRGVVYDEFMTIDQMLTDLRANHGVSAGGDWQEVYHFNNLVIGYSASLNDGFLNPLGLEWRPAANPPGAYDLSTHAHVSSARVRTLVNATARPSGQRQPGIGTAKVADPGDVNRWT
jgi:hypothetical protein